MKVFMLINTEILAEKDVFKKLGEIEEIEERYIVDRVYDIIIVFTVNNREEISKFKNEKILKIPGVRSTLTLQCL